MKPGQKVVCINGTFTQSNIGKCYSHLPIFARVYTVREVRPLAAEGGILVEEIRNAPIFFPIYHGYLEPAFHPNRFMPVKAEARTEERIEKNIQKEELVKSN